MAQHFLLSARARTLSLAAIFRMSDEEAYDTFKAIRFAERDGEPFCPNCACAVVYKIEPKAREGTKQGRCRRYKCKACHHQFTLTSGTIFASRKLPYQTMLAAIAIFANGAKGYAALHLSRDLNVQYKTAFVLAHKLREVLGSMVREAAASPLSGHVEVDGGYFGGYIKPKNRREDRVDRRRDPARLAKQQVVVVMRERGGRTLPFVTKSEAEGVPLIVANVDPGATVYADEGAWWNKLHGSFVTKRIDHSKVYSTPDACTNQAESYFSRFKRSQFGIHHRVAGKHLQAYASEIAWREDQRRVSNGEQWLAITKGATHYPISREWKGYWQRRKAA